MKIKPLNIENSNKKIEIENQNKHLITVHDPVQKSEFSNSNLKVEQSVALDNHLYAFIKSFRLKILITIFFSLIIWILTIVLGIIDYLVLETNLFAYILPLIIFIGGFYKMSISLIEYSAFKRDVKKYKADVSRGVSSTPSFLVRTYRQLYINQVSHNWITFYIFFFGGISLLLIHFLKNINWWIFDFKYWINDAFNHNVFFVEGISLGILGFAIIAHLVLAIFRKRKIYQLDSYFGSTISDRNALIEEKAKWNKFYRRIFYIVLLTVFVIPLLIYIAIRLWRRK